MSGQGAYSSFRLRVKVLGLHHHDVSLRRHGDGDRESQSAGQQHDEKAGWTCEHICLDQSKPPSLQTASKDNQLNLFERLLRGLNSEKEHSSEILLVD